jgi:hypothetical protein
MRLLLLLLFPVMVFANGNHEVNSHGGDASQHTTSGYEASNDSSSTVVVGVVNQHSPEGFGQANQSVSGGSTAVSVVQEYDEVANSAAPVMSDFCVGGISTQGEKLGISVGGTESFCIKSKLRGILINEAYRQEQQGDTQRASELDLEIDSLVDDMVAHEKARNLPERLWMWIKPLLPVAAMAIVL